MAVKYPMAPQKITDVSQRYILDFFTDKVAKGELTSKQAQEFAEVVEQCLSEAENKSHSPRYKQSAFQEYRKEFVKRYFPSLLNKEKSDDTENTLVSSLKKL